MKNKAILILTFIGLIGLLYSCEKDETKVYLLEEPIKPEFVSFPDLTFSAANAADTLVFKCTPVNLGFTTSASYFIEACATGVNYTPASTIVRIYFGPQDTLVKITEEALNKLFVKKFPANVPANVDFRIRSVINIDAGTGALGSSTNKFEVVSELTTKEITTY